MAHTRIAMAVPVDKDKGGTSRQVQFFESKIRPVLVKYCYECHSSDADEIGGDFVLDTAASMKKGGVSGPSLVPQDPDGSLLLRAIRYEGPEMPPDEPLPAAIVADFQTWILEGATDPRKSKPSADPSPGNQAGEQTLDSARHWSFFPRNEPSIPNTPLHSWAESPIDRFVESKLLQQELRPAEPASDSQLFRRLHYDLTGLPPTVEQAQRFVECCAKDPMAWQATVDSLLASPEFGRRWGRHWLDVARFGESNGDDGLGRNPTFPHAWRYRNYVIDAINEDTPYDRFLTEQIAGDLLEAHDAAQRHRQLVATGFLAIGAKPAAAMNKNFAMDIVDDQIATVATGVMGLSIACARCHDHKHDPITTQDYYALAGIFTSTETLYGLAGNEKLTAPPTDLHQLDPRWGSPDDSQAIWRQPLSLPENYHTTLGDLQPAGLERLTTAPEALHVDGQVATNSQHYGQVKDTVLKGSFGKVSNSYSVDFWFKNTLPNDSRPITAYLFSRAKLGDKDLPGDHLGIGGTHDSSRTGILFLFNGNQTKQTIAGSTVIAPGTWNHVTLIRSENDVAVYLNGRLELAGQLKDTAGESGEFCWSARSDRFAPLQGSLASLTWFDRPLSKAEASQLHTASGYPRAPDPQPLQLAMGVRDRKKITNTKVHVGGESGKLGEEVSRGVPAIFTSVAQRDSLPKIGITKASSGRLELAQWLTAPNHPHTARVAVNRIWMHLIGTPIVATPDDFGVYGARPTNPELLDYLASQLVRQDWSLKRLIREIVLSKTYRVGGKPDEALLAADPHNELFGWHPPRRLDAESLRDSILFVSADMDHSSLDGSDVQDVVKLINWPPGEASNLHQRSHRRSIYLCYLRHAPPPELAAFDLPDGVGSLGRRSESTLPTQALFLMNNEFVVRQARSLADRLLANEPRADQTSPEEIIIACFQSILGRPPMPNELAGALQHFARVRELHDDQLTAVSSVCQALISTLEFRYVR